MSSFSGLISEYPLVSVDNFGGKNLQSTTYFLSHCHTDHMQGLTSKAFVNRLENSPNCVVYCSECTRNILRDGGDVFGVAVNVIDRLVVLPCDTSYVVDVINHNGEVEYSLSVTTLQAGHCPGSVMFVFDGYNGTVLYTGDFRLYPGQSAVLPKLPRNVKTVYLDTTFCFPGADKFPKREEAIKSLCTMVSQWTRKNPAAPVFVSTKTRLGYEAVFVELQKALDKKIHVSQKKLTMYQSMPEVCDVLTLEESETNIHACDKCPVVRQATSALWIKLCASAFTRKHTNGKHTLKASPFSHSVCFSMHSSFSEIVEFVQLIKPQRIVPIAVPPGSSISQIVGSLPTCIQTESEQFLQKECLFEMETFRKDKSTGFELSVSVSGGVCEGLNDTDDLVYEDEIELPKPKRLKFKSV